MTLHWLPAPAAPVALHSTVLLTWGKTEAQMTRMKKGMMDNQVEA
jgi:hypothetical protein